jgi:crotonobetainyl-CoA:carnitine CoA-transferase CaiB-like acyl-CoA transferase
MAVPLIHFDYMGKAPRRVGVRHPSIAPYGAFATADGKAIILGIQNEREWQRLCAEVLGDPDLARDPRFCDNVQRVANRAELDALIAARFARETREALAATLTAADIAFGRLNEVEDFAAHPHLHRAAVATTAGPIALAAPPGAFFSELSVPALDQHGAALRREFAS